MERGRLCLICQRRLHRSQRFRFQFQRNVRLFRILVGRKWIADPGKGSDLLAAWRLCQGIQESSGYAVQLCIELSKQLLISRCSLWHLFGFFLHQPDCKTDNQHKRGNRHDRRTGSGDLLCQGDLTVPGLPARSQCLCGNSHCRKHLFDHFKRAADQRPVLH